MGACGSTPTPVTEVVAPPTPQPAAALPSAVPAQAEAPAIGSGLIEGPFYGPEPKPDFELKKGLFLKADQSGAAPGEQVLELEVGPNTLPGTKVVVSIPGVDKKIAIPVPEDAQPGQRLEFKLKGLPDVQEAKAAATVQSFLRGKADRQNKAEVKGIIFTEELDEQPAPPAAPLAAPPAAPLAAPKEAAEEEEAYEIEVPEGAVPGSHMTADIDGRTVRLTVPPGATAGQVIAFNLKGFTAKESRAATLLQSRIRGKLVRETEGKSATGKAILFTEKLDEEPSWPTGATAAPRSEPPPAAEEEATMFEIEVPEGLVPGNTISIDLPASRRSVKVVVPPGAAVGQVIAFNLKGAPKPLSKEEQAILKLQASIRGKVARSHNPEAAAVKRKSIVFTEALDEQPASDDGFASASASSPAKTSGGAPPASQPPPSSWAPLSGSLRRVVPPTPAYPSTAYAPRPATTPTFPGPPPCPPYPDPPPCPPFPDLPPLDPRVGDLLLCTPPSRARGRSRHR